MKTNAKKNQSSTVKKTKTTSALGDPIYSGAAQGGKPYKSYPDRIRVSVKFPEQGLTRQSQADECNINLIVDKFTKTGLMPPSMRGTPQYGDAPDATLFEAACVQAELRSQDAEGVTLPEETEEALSEPPQDPLDEILTEDPLVEETAAQHEQSG